MSRSIGVAAAAFAILLQLVAARAEQNTSPPVTNLYISNSNGDLDVVTGDGMIAVAERNFPFRLGELTPAAPSIWIADYKSKQMVIRYPTGSLKTLSMATQAEVSSHIVDGPDGCHWFTEGLADVIGKYCDGSGLTEYPLPNGIATAPGSFDKSHKDPNNIVVGPDSNMWFTESDGGAIGRITPKGKITQFMVPRANMANAPFGIASGPDGNIWFTLFGGYIGRITPEGEVKEYAVPPKMLKAGKQVFPVRPEIDSITSGPDGNLWFTEAESVQGQHDGIARITPSGKITEYIDLPPTCYPSGITVGPDEKLWFTFDEVSKGGLILKIGSITSQGKSAIYDMPQ